MLWYAMGKIVESDSVRATSEEAIIEATTTPDELLVSSPASVVGPSTPEAAANRRMWQKLFIADTESCGEDCDDEVMNFVNFDDNNVADSMEEPVAISRVRAFAMARGCTGRGSKVTLESARAKLDRVKATRGKHLTRRRLENFLSDHVDVGVNFLLSSEFQGQRMVLKSKGFSVEKARAKLEAVKIKKLEKSKVDKHVSMHITSSPARSSRKASKASSFNEELSKACSINEELSQEGVWVRQAKVKLESARDKKTKSKRKRKSQAHGTKKRNVQCRNASEVSCMDREDNGNGVDTIDGVKVTVDYEVAKEVIVNGKKRKAVKQMAVRVSERIANSRLRTAQMLVAVKVNAEIGSQKTKSNRKKGKKPEESNIKIRTGLSRKGEEVDATTSQSSAAVSLEFTSSGELAPPAKRRKTQQMLVDIIPPPGARLSSGVECVPPVSPYGLIQEHLYQDPWKVLVACMLLNKTGGRQGCLFMITKTSASVSLGCTDAQGDLGLFELCPDADTCVSVETEKIGRLIHSLGLQNKRAKTLQHFSQDYLGTTWTNVTQLHGIGEYARDAYAIFCEGRWQDVQPNDVVLQKYWQWLGDTQGLGYGFSQLE